MKRPITAEQRERYRARIIAAWQDDPDGWKHSIWAELGLDPQPPVSAEERWLVDYASRLEDDEAEAVIKTKVWAREAGNWVKCWKIGDPFTGPGQVPG